MDRFDIIQQLEGRYVPSPKGDYCLVEHGKRGEFNLLNYEISALEIMLRQSVSQEDVDYLTSERLTYLYTTNPPQFGTKPGQESHLWFEVIGNRIELDDGQFWRLINLGQKPTVNQEVAYPTTKQEQEALAWFNSLEPEAKLAQIKFRFQDWAMDQQRALQAAMG